jgi:hypothetical protein
MQSQHKKFFFSSVLLFNELIMKKYETEAPIFKRIRSLAFLNIEGRNCRLASGYAKNLPETDIRNRAKE